MAEMFTHCFIKTLLHSRPGTSYSNLMFTSLLYIANKEITLTKVAPLSVETFQLRL